MKFFLAILIAGAGVVGSAKDPGTADLRYNPATTADVRGVVTEVHLVPAGNALEGVHVTLKSKSGEVLDVYLAPADFLHLLKTTIAVGDDLHAIGSRVHGDTILTREFVKKGTSILLREANGAPVWQNWGVAADPSTVSQ